MNRKDRPDISFLKDKQHGYINCEPLFLWFLDSPVTVYIKSQNYRVQKVSWKTFNANYLIIKCLSDVL